MDICILSKKWLDKNTRILRQARVLSERGHSVTVVAISWPEPEMLDGMSGVNFVILNPAPGSNMAVGRVWFRFCNALYSPRKTLQSILRAFKSGGFFKKLVLAAGGTVCIFLAPFIFMAAILAWPFLWIAYLVVRLQTPRGVDCGVSGNDVLRFRYDRVLKALASPYWAEFRGFIFEWLVRSRMSGRKFDVVQAHDSHVLPVARAVAQSGGARLVFDAVEIFRDLSGLRFQRRPVFLSRMIDKKITRIIQNDVDRVICFGDEGADWYQAALGIKRPDVIWNCREFWAKKPDDRLRRDLGLSDQDRLIVVLNTMYEGQGLEQSVEALSMLEEKVHLCTIGWETTAGYMSHCQEVAKHFGVADRLHYVSRRPTWDLVPYSSGGDVALMARQKNNTLNNLYSLPNRIFEAVMARLPLACSDLPDIRRLVEDMDVGMIFDETDPQDIARTLSEMLEFQRLDHFKKRTSQAARVLCWENEGRSYAGIVEAVGRGDIDEPKQRFFDAFKVTKGYQRLLQDNKFRLRGREEKQDTLAA